MTANAFAVGLYFRAFAHLESKGIFTVEDYLYYLQTNTIASLHIDPRFLPIAEEASRIFAESRPRRRRRETN